MKTIQKVISDISYIFLTNLTICSGLVKREVWHGHQESGGIQGSLVTF